MDTQKAIDIVNAMETLGEALGMEVHAVGSLVAFYDDDKIKILNDAIATYVDFYKQPLVERGARLGIEINECST